MRICVQGLTAGHLGGSGGLIRLLCLENVGTIKKRKGERSVGL